jgi:glycosyltransferase involved in cell wall biosynthesis
VIPSYNAERFIAETIESVLAQTVEIAEIIVVDDGSADQTAKVADGFPRTKVIRRANGGQGAARNTGVDAAAGEWIAFLDHDDLWGPRKTEIQLRYITPNAGIFIPIDSTPFTSATCGTGRHMFLPAERWCASRHCWMWAALRNPAL